MSTHEVAAAVGALALVDHHCHGVVTAELDRAGFETLLSEGGPPAPGLTNADTPVGLAVRRHCAGVLGCHPHVAFEEYVARRAELGAAEVTARFLAASGTAELCVDTGFRSGELTSPGELADAAGGVAHEIVRLETVAEELAADGLEPAEFRSRFAERLATVVERHAAVGVKSVAAYRVGFDLAPDRPAADEVTGAAAGWLARTDPAAPRLDDPTLTRELLWAAVDLGRPIQLHVGFGDADIRMHRVDPSLLTDWLHRHRTPVMLLHCWPYQRQASFLAAVHPHVYLDVGLALHHVGPVRAQAVFAEAAELAPFGKLLYSSDAFGLAELYHLGALSFRRALTGWLGAQVRAGEWSAADAVRIAGLVGGENARRVYGLAA